jgi:phenylacetic acid degradation operon negative regulatory protein
VRGRRVGWWCRRDEVVRVTGAAVRPLSPRSIVLSLLLGMRTPRRSGAELVAWCALFGVAEGTARVALSRMVAAGELRLDAGNYELRGRMRSRRAEQEFALEPAMRDDDGEWAMLVVVRSGRAARQRAELRSALRHARFAERREGVWVRPANLDHELAPVVAEQCEAYRVRPEAPRALAAELFVPKRWAATAREFGSSLRAVTRDLPDERAIAPAFVEGARTAAHLRADPLLPPALLPARWPGERLRIDYREFQRAFRDAVRSWFATQ